MNENFTAAGIILICGKNKDRILMIHNKEKNSWDFPYGYKEQGSNCFSYSYSTLRINKNERKRK